MRIIYSLGCILIIASVISLFTTAPAFAAGNKGCDSAATFPLNIGAAATVPAVKDNSLTVFGMTQATSQAASLRAGSSNPCDLSATSSAVSQALAKVSALYSAHKEAQAKALLVKELNVVKRTRVSSHKYRSLSSAKRNLNSSCPDQAPHQKIVIQKVQDNMAIAQKAFEIKNEKLATQAVEAAQAAVKEWVQTPANQAKTVGDWIAIASYAEKLGVPQVITYAQGRARNQALADVEAASKPDKCTIKKADFTCWVKTIATAQMLGLDPGMKNVAQEMGKAIEDRIGHKAPAGCEEWIFQMSLTSTMAHTSDIWKIVYGAGRFRVNREKGLLDGSYQAGETGGGFSGIIGNATDECIVESPEGNTDYGPAKFTGGNFHYKIEGSISGDTIDLIVPSEDAHVTIQAPSDINCQLVSGVGEMIIDEFMKSGIPISFEASPTQEESHFDYTSGGTTFSATIKRVPLVAP